MGSPQRAPRPLGWPVLLAVATWLLLVTTGFVALRVYGAAPGRELGPASSWPEALGDPGGYALVMVVHPKCACSRSSLAELARLLARVSVPVTPHVVFTLPHNADESFRQGDLYDAAARLPGVVLWHDEGGVVTEGLGATTSGTTYLFDPDRRLLFSGGLTPSRSHEGDSVGRQQILALLAQGRSEVNRSAVYGCALQSEALTTLSTLRKALTR